MMHLLVGFLALRVFRPRAGLRQRVPGVVIRSTFIVGFPGETPEQFAELKDFILNELSDIENTEAGNEE